MNEAVLSALNIYNIANDKGNLEEWKKYNKKSLSSGFNDADSYSLIEWGRKMTNLVKCGKIERLIYDKKNIENVKGLFNDNKLDIDQERWLEEKLKKSDFGEKIRLFYYLGTAINDEKLINRVFSEIKDTIIKETLNGLEYNTSCKIVKDRHKVSLPLRVNFAGGWTDTPPYCLENGGKVLNAPILLEGNRPVEVYIEKIKQKK
jgi:fucokinase